MLLLKSFDGLMAFISLAMCSKHCEQVMLVGRERNWVGGRVTTLHNEFGSVQSKPVVNIIRK